jgi:hypothetical protein
MAAEISSVGSARRLSGCCLAAVAALLPVGAAAQSQVYTPVNGSGQIEVILKNHRFTPSEIHVPAGKRMQLLIKNQDDKAEEFDSTSLKVEKVIAGGGEGVVRLRELDPGRYPFMGEFHSETAQGVVIAE